MLQVGVHSVTPPQVQLVQTSFARLLPFADGMAALFYTRLFEQDPRLKYLFWNDMTKQGRKLVQVLETAVLGVGRPETIVPMLEELGRQHALYGVRPADYESVRSALLWTLERCMGDAWSAELRDAWNALYALLAGVMIQAGQALGDTGAEAGPETSAAI
jgi:hemoglobin-like flavoprotein